jgi:hypothetical protein
MNGGQMPKFQKRPVQVYAVQFTEEMALGNEPLPDGVIFRARSNTGVKLHSHRHIIETLEGEMQVGIGDYVITGVKGEKYPCKEEIFDATYSRVPCEGINGECVEIRKAEDYCHACR